MSETQMNSVSRPGSYSQDTFLLYKHILPNPKSLKSNKSLLAVNILDKEYTNILNVHIHSFCYELAQT